MKEMTEERVYTNHLECGLVCLFTSKPNAQSPVNVKFSILSYFSIFPNFFY